MKQARNTKDIEILKYVLVSNNALNKDSAENKSGKALFEQENIEGFSFFKGILHAFKRK